MSLPNPTVNPPFLASTSAQSRSLHSSRSPSRSRARRNDPLLRDLSPTKTLHAFSDPPRDQPPDALSRSIQHVSPSQRTLGTQVAQACTDIRAWTRELESWHWPGTFDFPEPARKKQRMSDMTILSRTESDDLKEDEYWGSLPASAVQAQEKRVEQICVEFDGVDFEALKAFVLAAHGQAGVGEASMDDSIGTIGAATDLKKLDDFTAVITATILQALPYLPRLTRLLETWTTRSSILRSAPRYLRDLKKARTDLDHGWAALAISQKHHTNASLTSESLEEMKALISAQVYSLGKRLDRFLDLLEGRPEVVPDSWIDDFEDLEQEYGEWVVRAEKKVLDDEWKRMKEQVRQTALGLTRSDEESNHTGIRNMPTEPDFDDEPAELEANEFVGGMTAMGASAFAARRIADDNTSRGTAEHAQPAIITTTITSSSKPPSSQSSPSRSRHVPIVIDYNNLGRPVDSSDQGWSADSEIASGRTSISQSRVPSRTGSYGPSATSTVKQRAAFLNGDIEKDQSLLKGKSAPIVRPFEHASNAFTRLFKRDSTDSNESRKQFKKHTDEVAKRSLEREHQRAASLLSASGSSSKVSSSNSKISSSTSNRNSDRMQHMDMATAFSEPRPSSRTEERSIRRGRTEKRDIGNRMAYGDLVMAVPIPTRGANAPRREDSKRSKQVAQERPETPARKSVESKRSKSAGSSRGDAMKRFAMELMGSPGRKSNEIQRSKRSMTPSADYSRMQSSPAVRHVARQSLDETRRQRSAPPKQQRESHDLTALPRGTFDRNLPQTYKPAVRSSQTMKQMNVPQTYRPTGFDPSVPHHAEQDQFPPNWPLSATPSEAGGPDEKEYFVSNSEWAPDWAQQQGPRDQGSVNSEQFEQFFVRTLPDSSAEQRYNTTRPDVVTRDFGYDTTAERPRSAPGFRARESRILVIPPRSSSRGAVPRRPWRADFSTNMPRPISMVLEEDLTPVSSSHDVSTNAAGFGYQDVPPVPSLPNTADNAAAYFGNQSVQRSAPAAMVELPTALPDASDNAAAYFGNQGVRLSEDTVSLEPRMHAVTDSEVEEVDEDEVVTPRAEPVLRRASVTSIESHSRDELKAVKIRRSTDIFHDDLKALDIPSPVVEDPTPRPMTPPARELPEAQSDGPMKFNGEMEFPSPPSSIPGQRTSVRSSISSGISTRAVQGSEWTTVDAAPLNAAMQKKRGSLARTRNSVGERDVVSPVPSSSPQDNFDRQVTKVIDKVRAPIKFKSRPGAVTPVTRTSALAKMSERKSMTLVPAESSPKKASPVDPEVKLYHLTQAGRSEPIKLYVRLVGEGSERVMVRVGGGWADLADYLRQYAEHHGSRTVSEGNLELQTADTTNNWNTGGGGSASGKRTFSGPALTQEPKSRSPVTPTIRAFGPDSYTPNTMRTTTDRSFDPPRPSSRTAGWGSQPMSKPRLWIGGDSDDEEDDLNQSPEQASTPRSAKPASRPTTATRPDSRSAADPVSPGLDGKIRPELPEQKAKWVEGMIEKAMKSASAASAGGEKAGRDAAAVEKREREFGDIGRVGGTRRVVFRPG